MILSLLTFAMGMIFMYFALMIAYHQRKTNWLYVIASGCYFAAAVCFFAIGK